MWKKLMIITIIWGGLLWILFVTNILINGHFNWIVFPQAVLWSGCAIFCWMKFRQHVSTSYLILSGEGNIDTEHQFCMELNTLEEANFYFNNFKRGQFKDTNLFIYEAKKIREE